MKRTIIYTLFLLSFVCQQANATHIVQNQYDSSLNQSEHMSWWTHDRFGLFIHWGLYAMPARHEWVKSREKMSDEHYNRYKNPLESGCHLYAGSDSGGWYEIGYFRICLMISLYSLSS